MFSFTYHCAWQHRRERSSVNARKASLQRRTCLHVPSVPHSHLLVEVQLSGPKETRTEMHGNQSKAVVSVTGLAPHTCSAVDLPHPRGDRSDVILRATGPVLSGRWACDATVVGRRNHFGSKSRRGTQAAAILYSLVETAKASGVSPSAYLLEVLRAAMRDSSAVTFPPTASSTTQG